MGLVVRPATGHSIAFVKLMEEHVAPLFFFDVIIDPDFVLRDEFINIVVAAFSKVDIEHAANEATVDDPNADAVFELFPQSFVNLFPVGQFLAVMGQTAYISGTAALLLSALSASARALS